MDPVRRAAWLRFLIRGGRFAAALFEETCGFDVHESAPDAHGVWSEQTAAAV